MANQSGDGHSGTTTTGPPRMGRVALRLGLYLVACVALVVVRSGPFPVVVAALLAVGGTASALGRTAWSELQRDNSAPSASATACAQVGWLVGGAPALVPLLIGCGLAVAWLVSGASGLGFLALALTYVGAGLALASLRLRLHDPVPGAAAVLGVAGVAVVVGLVVARWWAPAIWVAATGLLVSPIGVALASAAWLRTRSPVHPPPRILAATATTTVAAPGGGGSHRWGAGPRARWAAPMGWLIDRLARTPLPALVVVGAILVAGVVAAVGVGLDALGGTEVVLVAVVAALALAITARTNADVVLVVLLVATTWSMTNRTTENPWNPQRGTPAVVALGDSYISGEGATTFYEGTNTVGVDECRRAPTAYPALLATAHPEGVDADLLFVACSGARISDLSGQLDQVERSGVVPGLVLVSIGGNDAEFGSIAQTCLGPGDCSVLLPAWLDQLDALESDLAVTYRRVAEETGGRVVVVPYPQAIGPDRPKGCPGSMFTEDERLAIGTFVHRLDTTIVAAANEARRDGADITVVTGAESALEGHRLCEAPPGSAGINLLALNGKDGSFEQALVPTNWLHNSVHPNELGHQLMADAIRRHLSDRAAPSEEPAARSPGASSEESSDDDGRPVDTPCHRSTPATGAAGSGADVVDLAGCQGDWSVAQVSAFGLWPGSLVVIAFVGAWLMALAVVATWQRIFDDPVPNPSAPVPNPSAPVPGPSAPVPGS